MWWMFYIVMCEGIVLLLFFLFLIRCVMMNLLVKFFMLMIIKKWYFDDFVMVEGVFDLLVSEIFIVGEIILVDLGMNEIKYYFILYIMYYILII